ncbi:cobalt ECF transporter T component CbiQ [Actinomadura gamaensis]|uniref:Cobalt ECF transporter T component CbiQ n=1 Tax=Actinomadura gamaensis TaxID=1763541 RepID=A0ABV9TS97_9ACTN
MSGGHVHRLYRAGDGPVHRLPPQCKILGTLGFGIAVVATPRDQVWAFGCYALILAAVAAASRVPPGFLLRRMAVELPFVGFAFLLPFVVPGPHVHLAGVPLSTSGLWSSWNVLAKATLGVTASILLAATTEPRTLLLGVERLRLPPLIVQIATFMLRYTDVVLDEIRRMRTARLARGFDARDLRHVPVLARSLSALFLRSYERGERVYVAMASRGYSGTTPTLHDVSATARQWAATGLVPAVAAAVAATAWMVPG